MSVSPGPHNHGPVYHEIDANVRLRLFCLPYAGGGAAIFRTWPQYLSESIEVVPIELPGRGERLNETPFTSINDIVDSVTRFVAARSDKPFALFGHSMGAIISFEVTRQLRRERRKQPLRIFASGRRAPQMKNESPYAHTLSNAEFLAVLHNLNGSSPEALQNAELMELLLPIIRADFMAIETYAYSEEPPLECSIFAYGGLQDEYVQREQIEPWKMQASGSFRLQWLDGDHFFINSNRKEFLEILSDDLEELIGTTDRFEYLTQGQTSATHQSWLQTLRQNP